MCRSHVSRVLVAGHPAASPLNIKPFKHSWAAAVWATATPLLHPGPANISLTQHQAGGQDGDDEDVTTPQNYYGVSCFSLLILTSPPSRACPRCRRSFPGSHQAHLCLTQDPARDHLLQLYTERWVAYSGSDTSWWFVDSSSTCPHQPVLAAGMLLLLWPGLYSPLNH